MNFEDLMIMDFLADMIKQDLKLEQKGYLKPRQNNIDAELAKRGITGIYYNKEKKIVVISWKDNTTTKAKCADEDDFDLMVGFSIAYCTKKFGSKSHLNKLINDNARENISIKSHAKEDVPSGCPDEKKPKNKSVK